jgi:tetratricopeptide (TPR) repeat protein
LSPFFSKYYEDNTSGTTKYAQDDYEEAIRFYEKALDIVEPISPANEPVLTICHNSMGLMYSKMGDYFRALFFYEKAVDIRRKCLPENHPSLATS